LLVRGVQKVIDKGKGWMRRIYILGAGHMGGGRRMGADTKSFGG